MIDLHAHLLPGLDDGPATLDDCLQMLRVMQDQGVRTVVAAAHAQDGRYNATREAVLRSTEAVNLALHASGLRIEVLPSMELYLTFDLLRMVKSGQVLGLHGTKYLVVELPHREFPLYTERALFELMMSGYRPLLNHPERNLAIQRKPELMERLAEKGVGGMVTAASLLGRFGPDAKRLGERFLAEEAATLLVSDAHDTKGRAPMLPEGLAAAKRFGKPDQAAEAMILDGSPRVPGFSIM